ncbi:MAG TPA: CotH kinase family protein, partial [Chthoniobacteraceae bacterium]|nr:CotH kinase family protein [Chthoniobacteraceae bacterium]
MRRIAFLALIFLSVVSLQAQSLRITEFLATNVNGIVDENSTPQGWIEIWNPNATAKTSMNGMKLTDGTNTWTFPFVEIMPDERMIVWASGKNRTVATAPLHTNFTIPSGGGTLRLLRSDNVVLSEIANYPAQQPDVSWGRDEWDVAVSPTQVGFYTVPTPEERNSFEGPGVAGKVAFSQTSRAYTASPGLQITLSQVVPDPDAVIRYTTNGTVPTATSTVYSNPLTVTGTQQIRARVYKPGLLPGETESNAFLLLDATSANFSSAMPLLVLTSFGAGISDTLDTNTYLWVWEPAAPDNRSRFTNPPKLVSRTVVDKRGSSTLGNPKFNLNMELRNGRDDDDRDEELVGMPEHSDWVLHAPWEFDRSDLHNPLAFALSNAAGRYAPRTKQAEVFIDSTGGALTVGAGQTGDYFGVYNVMEKIRRDGDRIDIVNLRKYDNSTTARTGGYIWKVDRLDSGDSGFTAGGQSMAYYEPKELEIKSPQRDPQEQYLTSYINSFNSVLQSGSWNNPTTGYAAWLDVPGAVDHHLVNVWTFNVDALRLSGYWTKQRGAKMIPLPVWDFDRTLSSTDGRDANPLVWRSQVADMGTDFFNYIWWNRLFQDINFYQKYIDRWQDLRRGALSKASVDAMIDALNAEISAEAITRDVSRWGKTKRAWTSPFTGINYPASQAAEVQRLKDYLQQRANFMDSQWVAPVATSVAEGNVPVGTEITLTGPAGSVIYYTLNGDDPRPFGGGVPGAGVLTYTGTPITITATTRLRARAYDDPAIAPNLTPLTGANNPPLASKWSGLTNVRYSV